MDVNKKIEKLVSDFRLTHPMTEDDCDSLKTKIRFFATELEYNIKNKQ